jgi:hypothetical protein
MCGSKLAANLGHQLDVLVLERRRYICRIQRVVVAEVHDEAHSPAGGLLHGEQVRNSPGVCWRLVLPPAFEQRLQRWHAGDCLGTASKATVAGVPCTALTLDKGVFIGMKRVGCTGPVAHDW